MDSQGRKVVVCDNGTGVSPPPRRDPPSPGVFVRTAPFVSSDLLEQEVAVSASPAS